LTGDFLFSTFGTAEDRVVVLRGFTKLPPALPEPASVLLFGLALAGLTLIRSGSRCQETRLARLAK